MAKSAQDVHWTGYAGTATMLVLALLFPVGLMIFDPTLMFERGWEQYVGTGIYFWAVVTLGRELVRIWRNEQAFDDAPLLLKRVNAALARGGSGEGSSLTSAVADDDSRILPLRVRQLTSFLRESRSPSVTQLMEVNREGSGLDQEQMAGRFTLTRYILYLLPVIGFIGTVEGISKALMNISKVLPMVKNLDGFLTNLTSVTAALQIAFDSTLLALFLSAALMLVQTLVFRRSEDILARVDRWVVEHVLPHVGTDNPLAEQLTAAIGKQLDELGNKLTRALEPAVQALHEQTDKLGESLRVPIGQFAREMERLPDALIAFKQGADTIGRIGADLEAIGSASESLRRGVASLSRIETLLGQMPSSHVEIEEIKRGLEQAGASIDTLAGSWSAAYERSSRATQEQLARSLTSLKDALEMLNVSMEQGNSLYRNIVKKLFDERHEAGPHRPESIKVA
jgi:biopolymer transport protein ExbB/TolQ